MISEESVSPDDIKPSRRFRPITLYFLGSLVILIPSVAMILPTFLGDSNEGCRINLMQTMVSSGGPAGMQIDVYRSHMNHYPASLTDLTIRPASDDPLRWQGPYIKDINSLIDRWNRPLRYRYPSQRDHQIYDLWSAGPDGIDHTDDDITNWPKE